MIRPNTLIHGGVTVACLIAGTALFAQDDPKQTVAKLYGNRLNAVAATPAVEDDLSLANEMLAVARESGGKEALVAELCSHAGALGSIDIVGYATAIEAYSLVASNDPERRIESLEKILPLRQKLYHTGRGDMKDATGRALVEDHLALAGAQEENSDWEQATQLLRAAATLAPRVGSDRGAEIREAIDGIAQRQKIYKEIQRLRDQIKTDPKNAEAAAELAKLYVIQLDRPAEARKYSFLIQDSKLKENLRLAGRAPASLQAMEHLQLGDWYRSMADSQTDDAKPRLLRRAKTAYQHFLDSYTEQDLARTKATISLKAIDRDMQALGVTETAGPNTPITPTPTPPGNTPAAEGPYAKAFLFQGGYLSPSPSNAISHLFKARTIEMWVKPGTRDGIIYEEGGSTHGMAIAVRGNDIRFMVTILGTEHETIGAMASRDAWIHVTGQFNHGEVALFLDGKATDFKKTLGLKNLPPYSDGVGVGSSNGYSAFGFSRGGFNGAIAQLRISSAARYRRSFRPSEKIRPDKATLLMLDAEKMPDGPLKAPIHDAYNTKVRWDPSGDVSIGRP